MNLPTNITRKVSRKILILKKQSPHIFFAVGVVGSVTSTVLACRATLKLSDALEDIQRDLDRLHEDKRNDFLAEWSSTQLVPRENRYKKDVARVYAKGGFQIAKLYGPAAIVGVASITALTGSHIQMTKRNAALMAAYAAVQKAYEDYRERVREELGDERELEIYHAVEKDNDDNKVADPNKWSPYARFFDEYSKNWEKDPELNRLFVQCIQNYANNLLQARGHVFLNEVYDMLGLDRSKAGAVVGWLLNSEGDNYVDFGIFEASNSKFVNGWERSILLDFNVDGVIFDKI